MVMIDEIVYTVETRFDVYVLPSAGKKYVKSGQLKLNLSKKLNYWSIMMLRMGKSMMLMRLAMIDSNAHSGHWESRDTNERGRKLEDIIMSKDLIVANRGSIPTIHVASKTIIDISLLE